MQKIESEAVDRALELEAQEIEEWFQQELLERLWAASKMDGQFRLTAHDAAWTIYWFLRRQKEAREGSSESAPALKAYFHACPNVYCLKEVNVGVRNAYLPLDRRYKPIGGFSFHGSLNMVDYDQFAELNGYLVLDVNASHLDVWVSENEADGLYFLYSDDPKTRETYPKRLGKLSAFVRSKI